MKCSIYSENLHLNILQSFWSAPCIQDFEFLGSFCIGYNLFVSDLKWLNLVSSYCSLSITSKFPTAESPNFHNKKMAVSGDLQSITSNYRRKKTLWSRSLFYSLLSSAHVSTLTGMFWNPMTQVNLQLIVHINQWFCERLVPSWSSHDSHLAFFFFVFFF